MQLTYPRLRSGCDCSNKNLASVRVSPTAL
jgi:hypothetical protein